MHLLLIPIAWSGSWVLEVSDPVYIDERGTFARAFPAEGGGWHLFLAAGGDLIHRELTADFDLAQGPREGLTGYPDMVDHAIVPCPDGTWLHTGHVPGEPADSARVFLYDASLTLVEEAVALEGTEKLETNDMALICSEPVRAMGVTWRDKGPGTSSVVMFGEGLAPSDPLQLDGRSMLMGGSIVWDSVEERLMTVGQEAPRGHYFHITAYDVDWNLQDAWSVWTTSKDVRAYWPQGAVRVGNAWLVAHMVRDDEAGWTEESDVGDVYVSVFDLGWNLLESVALTALEPPDGAMRPYLVVDGEMALVAYDVLIQPVVNTLVLDLAALASLEDPREGKDTGLDTAGNDTGGGSDSQVPQEDSGEPTSDSDEPGGTVDTGAPMEDQGCLGCRSKAPDPPSALMWLGLGWGWGWRRRPLS